MTWAFWCVLLSSLLLIASAQEVPVPPGSCGAEWGGALCPVEGYCCSKWGFCRNTSDYCDPHKCQSQCPPPPPPPSPPPPPQSPPPPPPSPPPLPPPSPPPPPPRPPTPAPNRCGIGPDGTNYGIVDCGEGRCCSNWAWCGEGDEFCSPGSCQYSCKSSLSFLSAFNRKFIMSAHNHTYKKSVVGAVL